MSNDGMCAPPSAEEYLADLANEYRAINSEIESFIDDVASLKRRHDEVLDGIRYLHLESATFRDLVVHGYHMPFEDADRVARDNMNRVNSTIESV